MIVDFWRTWVDHSPLCINGPTVERVISPGLSPPSAKPRKPSSASSFCKNRREPNFSLPSWPPYTEGQWRVSWPGVSPCSMRTAPQNHKALQQPGKTTCISSCRWALSWILLPPVIWQRILEHPCHRHQTWQEFLPWNSQITQPPAVSQHSPELFLLPILLLHLLLLGYITVCSSLRNIFPAQQIKSWYIT